MGILEKLRPAPRWKHADPAVRMSAIYELGAEDGDALRTLAREDADARVRRAAVVRIDDVPVLMDVARTDPDEDVRAEALRNLVGLAAETDDPSRARTVVEALTSLGRTKELVVLVREAAHVPVRTAAVDAIDDQKSLGSVSRQAADGATRLRALARVTDADELLNVATKSEHTDAAVAALERIESHEGLQAIAQRARNKVAARRARTKLRQIDEAAQPAVSEPAAAMTPEDRERAHGLLARVEVLVIVGDTDAATASLAETRLAWAELQADSEVEAALAARFDAGVEAVREAIAEREREREAEVERERTVAREQADRLAICQEIEGLSGPDAQDRIAELKVQWDGLPPIPAEYAASLTRRFQDACRAFGERERRAALAASAGPRLESLAGELEQLVASGQSAEDMVTRWRGLRRDADVLREFGELNPAAAQRVEQAIATLEEKEQEHQQARARQEQDNLRRLQQLCRQVETLVAGESLSLKAGDRALRDIRTALDARAPLPTKKDRQDIQARLEQVRTVLAPRVQELRDADEWQRWANLQVQEELCKQMDALAAEADLELASRKMRELQARWKEVALAPRTQGEAMWQRFKTAQDAVFAKTSAHMAAQQEERGANLAKKQSLCERAEALSGSSDWVKTASAIQALQAEWKTVGPVSRGSEKAVWERFRAACDAFFTRRHEDLKKRKDEWSANLTRKEALCAAVEALVESTDWEQTAAQLKRLQAEWKGIGPVRKSKSEVVWQRFRTACDAFFERYKHRDQIALQGKAAPRDEVIRELEALLPSGDSASGEAAAAPEGLAATVQQARSRWQQAPELPRAVQQDMASRYHEALSKLLSAWPDAFVGTDLDPTATRKRMEVLIGKVEQLLQQQPKLPANESPAERLARQWTERLAANTMTGGRTGDNDESRWKAADQEVRSLQAQWTRLGPVPADVAGPLNERFQRACRKFYDQHRRAS
jgi:hypothetical protein